MKGNAHFKQIKCAIAAIGIEKKSRGSHVACLSLRVAEREAR